MVNDSAVAQLVAQKQQQILTGWVLTLTSKGTDIRIGDAELKAQASELLRLLADAFTRGGDVEAPGWEPVRQFLQDVSNTRAVQGFSASETATFIFSLKKPLFDELRRDIGKDAVALADAIWEATELIDALGMHVIRTFQKSREAVIARQQEELLELSTPVVKLWNGVLALPMIGTLDSARTQVVMESLLESIVSTGAEVAIIDITGVPTVDTLVAQHLLKTVTAIRLMGAECIISGIRPQIAQTIVHLGIDLGGVATKATLADALAVAFQRSGLKVVAADAA
jgi:rsbT co-antagonist protein RsbR